MSLELTPIPVSDDILDAVASGSYYSPRSVLGAYLGDNGITIRVIVYLADAVDIIAPIGAYTATHERGGIWVTALSGKEATTYRVSITYGEGTTVRDDPYRYPPTLGGMGTYLVSEGRHKDLWKVLDVHAKTYTNELGETTGTAFAVWAPNTRAARVVGEFNCWDDTQTSICSLGSSGVWGIFVPKVGVDTHYKFGIQGPGGSWSERAGPMVHATEIPPATAPVVTDYFHEWSNREWMQAHRERDVHNGPISIYEARTDSQRQGLGYRELADELVPCVKQMGFTYVEFVPLAEHPFDGSWGYQVTFYCAPSSRYGTPDGFRCLVDAFHREGIDVILNWVPTHFPKGDFALTRLDGTPLYEDPDPLHGEHPDWGTYVLNFGHHEMRNFLVTNALYWLGDLRTDGLRIDAVASMLCLDYSCKDDQWWPNQYGGRKNLETTEFIQEVDMTAYRRHPDIVMIAREPTAWPGVTVPTSGGGLSYGVEWDMGWMNDTLHYLSENSVNRRWHHGGPTFSLVYVFSENYALPLLHDGAVHGKGSLISKMPGDKWQRLAGPRSLYAYQWSHPGEQLIFMDQEIDQEQEWNESYSLDWWSSNQEGHAGVTALMERLNKICTPSPTMWDGDCTGFEWVDASDGDRNLISYPRKRSGNAGNCEIIVCISNFAGNPHEGHRVGLPFGDGWVEVLNTDSEEFGGSDVVGVGAIIAKDTPRNGHLVSASLRVPPLGAVWLIPASQTH